MCDLIKKNRQVLNSIKPVKPKKRVFIDISVNIGYSDITFTYRGLDKSVYFKYELLRSSKDSDLGLFSREEITTLNSKVESFQNKYSVKFVNYWDFIKELDFDKGLVI